MDTKKRQQEFLSGTTGWRLSFSCLLVKSSVGKLAGLLYQAVSGSRLLRSSDSAS